MSPAVAEYVVAHSSPPDAVQSDLAERTAKLGDIARMQIGHDQGAFMTLLTRLLDVRFAVEVGTFTGYSALCIARGLGEGGRLLCCDVSESWTAIARDAWRAAGVDDRITLRLAPAAETLAALPDDQHVDLAFIDADKTNYGRYYDLLLPRLRPNGVMLVDNTLWSGKVLDPSDTSDDTVALRAFNAKVAADATVEAVMLTIGDGVTVIRKR